MAERNLNRDGEHLLRRLDERVRQLETQNADLRRRVATLEAKATPKATA